MRILYVASFFNMTVPNWCYACIHIYWVWPESTWVRYSIWLTLHTPNGTDHSADMAMLSCSVLSMWTIISKPLHTKTCGQVTANSQNVRKWCNSKYSGPCSYCLQLSIPHLLTAVVRNIYILNNSWSGCVLGISAIGSQQPTTLIDTLIRDYIENSFSIVLSCASCASLANWFYISIKLKG